MGGSVRNLFHKELMELAELMIPKEVVQELIEWLNSTVIVETEGETNERSEHRKLLAKLY